MFRPNRLDMSTVALGIALLSTASCVPRLYTDSSGDTDLETGQREAWVEPENGWPVSPPPETLVAEGFGVGQVVPDLRLLDQHGQEVSLWQFYGKIVLLDISTMWCAPCQELARGTEHTQELFGTEEFAYVTVLQENVESQPPDDHDLNLWAENFGITSPILADGDKETSAAVQQGQYPAVLLIGPDLRVVERVNPPDDPTVQSSVQALL